MPSAFVQLQYEHAQLTSLFKLFQKEPLTHQKKQVVFPLLLESFYQQCRGLNALHADDPLHRSQITYHTDGYDNQAPNFDVAQLNQHFRRLMQKVGSTLPDILYRALERYKNLLDQLIHEEHDDVARLVIERCITEWRVIATDFLNQYKVALHVQLKETLEAPGNPDIYTKVLRQSIEEQNHVVKTWGEFLHADNRKIDLRGATINLSDVDLSGLDLRYVQWNEFTQLQSANLSDALCDPVSFMLVKNLRSVMGLSPTLLAQIQTQRFAWIQERIRLMAEGIAGYQGYLDNLGLMDKLLCTGEVPNFMDCPDSELHVLAIRMLTDPYIALSDDPEYIEKNFDVTSITPTTSREVLLDVIYTGLKTRHFMLPTEVIAYSQQNAMYQAFEHLKKIREELDEVIVLAEDLTDEQKSIVLPVLKIQSDNYQALKCRKDNFKEAFDQKLIQTFLNAFDHSADVLLGINATGRLCRMLEIAKFQDDIVLDLSGNDLSLVRWDDGERWNKLDFKGVWVRLTPEQFASLPKQRQDQIYAELFEAIKNNDKEKAAHCLVKGALNINYQNIEGRTPLMVACHHQYTEMATLLLEHGASANIQAFGSGLTVMETAARFGQVEMVTTLKAQGVKLDLVSAAYLGDMGDFENITQEEVREYPSLLSITITHKHYAVMRRLVEVGADIEAIEANKTPLEHLCEKVAQGCKKEDLTAAAFLLDRGAVVTRRMLHVVCEQGNRLLALLLRQYIREEIDFFSAVFLNETETIHAMVGTHYHEVIEEGYTPLVIACRGGNVDVVIWLLANGANPYLSVQGKPAMLHAIEKDQLAIVTHLLAVGISTPPAVAERCWMPFCNAIVLERVEITEALLQYCKAQLLSLSFIDYGPADASPPLIQAVCRGNEPLVYLLLAFGANPGVRDKDGKTALHHAAAAGSVEMTERLLQAMVSSKDQAGQTPLALAQLKKQTRIVELFSSFGVGDREDEEVGDQPQPSSAPLPQDERVQASGSGYRSAFVDGWDRGGPSSVVVEAAPVAFVMPAPNGNVR